MQLDLTSFCVMNREASARRPWPMGAPPSFRASLRRRGKAAPLLRFQRTVNYLREAGERAHPRPHLYSRPRGDGCDITAMNASVGILKRRRWGQMAVFFFCFFFVTREPPNNNKAKDCFCLGGFFQTWRRPCQCEKWRLRFPEARIRNFPPLPLIPPY